MTPKIGLLCISDFSGSMKVYKLNSAQDNPLFERGL